MAKPGYTIIAEHFSTDSSSVKDCEYQAGRFNKPVYAISDDSFYSGGKKRPVDSDGVVNNWSSIISSYDSKSIIWVSKCH